jgi:hypothetical protein
MHWRTRRFVPSVEPHTIKSGRQFIALHRYQRRDRWFLYYLGLVHLVATFGLFKMIELLW